MTNWRKLRQQRLNGNILSSIVDYCKRINRPIVAIQCMSKDNDDVDLEVIL